MNPLYFCESRNSKKGLSLDLASFAKVRTIIAINYEFNPSLDAGVKRQSTFLCTLRVVKYYNGP